MLCDDLDGWDGVGDEREVQEGEDICIHIADSLHCTAETNNTVKQLYSNKKKYWKEVNQNGNSKTKENNTKLTVI